MADIANIMKEVTIAAPIEKVWAALTDAKTIKAWMDDSKIKIDLKVGGKYALFSGETTGVFTQIDAPAVLEYTWRQSGWREKWADSLVRWELREEDGSTAVILTHSKFPTKKERDDHDEGWDAYWLEPMRAYLEKAGK